MRDTGLVRYVNRDGKVNIPVHIRKAMGAIDENTPLAVWEDEDGKGVHFRPARAACAVCGSTGKLVEIAEGAHLCRRCAALAVRAMEEGKP